MVPIEKIEKISIEFPARIIVISDIHGELPLLQKLLKKVAYKPEDYLIINGDMIEKGEDSSGVLHYVMKHLSNQDRVFVTEGNCEILLDALLEENPKFVDYVRMRKQSIFREWLDQIHFTLTEQTTVQQIKDALTHHFSKEIDFLLSLPTVIEMDDYLFVHAGLEDRADWQNTDRGIATTQPEFLTKIHQADKFVVVGHWPVANYCINQECNNPIIDREKKIIAIDGGNVMKSSGQLNALLIDRTEGKSHFSYTSVDYLPLAKVSQNYQPEKMMQGLVNYPSYRLYPLEKGEHFTKCLKEDKKTSIYVKNEYIKEADDGSFLAKDDLSCCQLEVSEDDEVSVVDDSCSGYTLVKKAGYVGWIPKKCLTDMVR